MLVITINIRYKICKETILQMSRKYTLKNYAVHKNPDVIVVSETSSYCLSLSQTKTVSASSVDQRQNTSTDAVFHRQRPTPQCCRLVTSPCVTHETCGLQHRHYSCFSTTKINEINELTKNQLCKGTDGRLLLTSESSDKSQGKQTSRQCDLLAADT